MPNACHAKVKSDDLRILFFETGGFAQFDSTTFNRFKSLNELRHPLAIDIGFKYSYEYST